MRDYQSWYRRRWSALLLAWAGVFLATASAGAGTISTDILDFGFLPNEVSIVAGDEVVWTNTGEAVHTVIADEEQAKGPRSPRIGTGESYGYAFDTPGSFTYHCEIHPSMRAVVHVASRPAATTAAASTTAAPPTNAPPTTTTTRRGTMTTTASRPPIVTPPTPSSTEHPPPTVGSVAPPARSVEAAPVAPQTTITTIMADPAASPSLEGRSDASLTPGARTKEAIREERREAVGFDRRTALMFSAILIISGGLFFLWELRPHRR